MRTLSLTQNMQDNLDLIPLRLKPIRALIAYSSDHSSIDPAESQRTGPAHQFPIRQRIRQYPKQAKPNKTSTAIANGSGSELIVKTGAQVIQQTSLPKQSRTKETYGPCCSNTYTRSSTPVTPANDSVSTPSLCKTVTKSRANGFSSASISPLHPTSLTIPAPA